MAGPPNGGILLISVYCYLILVYLLISILNKEIYLVWFDLFNVHVSTMSAI